MTLITPIQASCNINCYQARDVINAPQIKAAIQIRTHARSDDAEILQWLENHFYRWLIGCFEHATPIQTLADYQQLTQHPAPAWLSQKLAGADTQLFWIEPDHPQLLNYEHQLREFLYARQGTKLAKKLQRINCQQAFDLWAQEHALIAERRRKGWVPSSGEGLIFRHQLIQGAIFEFDHQSPQLREELAYESYHMQHCLGQFHDQHHLTGGYGEYYVSALKSGQLRIFTLRNQQNNPHVTISLNVGENTLSIEQIKGKQNRPPIIRYARDVLAFLQALQIPVAPHPDCLAMGITSDPETNTWCMLNELADQTLHFNALCANPLLLPLWPEARADLNWAILSSNHWRPDKNWPDTFSAAQRMAAGLSSELIAPTEHDPLWFSKWLTAEDTLLEIEGIAIPSLAEMRAIP